MWPSAPTAHQSATASWAAFALPEGILERRLLITVLLPAPTLPSRKQTSMVGEASTTGTRPPKTSCFMGSTMTTEEGPRCAFHSGCLLRFLRDPGGLLPPEASWDANNPPALRPVPKYEHKKCVKIYRALTGLGTVCRYYGLPEDADELNLLLYRLGNIRHPNVLRVPAVCAVVAPGGAPEPGGPQPDHLELARPAPGDSAGLAFFEHIDGGDLFQLASGPNPGPLCRRPGFGDRVCADVLRGMLELHRHGILHGDIKPDNVFIRRSSGQAVLGDFSHSRPVDGDGPPAFLVQCPQHRAPEIQRAHADGTLYESSAATSSLLFGSPASDFYAFGMFVYYVLCGSRVVGLCQCHLWQEGGEESDPVRNLNLEYFLRLFHTAVFATTRLPEDSLFLCNHMLQEIDLVRKNLDALTRPQLEAVRALLQPCPRRGGLFGLAGRFFTAS